MTQSTNQLPQDVVTEDHELDQASELSAELLAQHRWHWTLDETNPDRVSFRAYARAVGVEYSRITRQVKGYVMWCEHGKVLYLTECIRRASMGAETEAATEAVAKARGQSFTGADGTRRREIRHVREVARQRAEDRGTSVEDEAPRVAEMIVKAEQADARRAEDRKQRLGFRFVELDGHLLKAKRALTDAVRLADEVPWGDEERDLLSHTVGNIRSLVGLVDLALTGSSKTDFDAELAKLLDAEQGGAS